MSVIRTFRAASVREALALVRAELGDEALVLGQREIRGRRLPWRKAKVETELTAAIATGRLAESTAPTRLRKTLPTKLPVTTPNETSAASWARQQVTHGGDRVPATEGNSSGPVANCVNSHGENQILTAHPGAERLLTSRGKSAAQPVDPFRLYAHLIEQDVDEDCARVLIGELQREAPALNPSPAILPERCRDLLARSVECGGGMRVTPGRRRIAALVGPTGVGKTTTIAKLAANFRLRDRLRVGLITVDTYRVAAVEQLRTYAELIDVPMQVVTSPREMPRALDDLAEMDLVLIDTAGRSPSDDLKIQELRSFLQAAHADEVHLVASLTSGPRNLAITVERFRRVGPTSMLLTKLDEAAGPGAIISAAWEADLPLSYITTGQDVPDDIETANPDVIAQRVLPTGAESSVDEWSPDRPAAAARTQTSVT